ncbi:MAG: phosphoribosylformylglycinamidine synthase subunit PurL [Candidatus Thermoplasmatota archaeon]|nr:phosphoribosylformylglycinamidine synthase subunit PurL [Candidatus Thermoplasmatota archaeon]
MGYKHEINLEVADDEKLMQISREYGLALSLDEMKKVRDYFLGKKRNPTDVELQSIGQAWSEHCCYKSSKSILKEFVFGIDNGTIISREDAGVVEFDEKHAYALRIESHNHPSAVEPYGGAATGIGGIVRDILCMGCQPVALVDPLFFGNLNIKYKQLPKGVKHPKYLFSGVVSGIRDYGNRIGIPTVSGCVYFDQNYVGNPLVNVGCVGIGKKSNITKSAVKKPGDLLVLVGGKTGRDGIHGVTFASEILTEKSEDESRGSVQLGDPIMKEPLIHACLECVEKKLLNGMKDLGGGGLSCVVGEMALAAGFGADVQLDSVPLKEKGLNPWEIWVSESQERMMLAVDEKKLEEVLDIFKLWGIPATVVGKIVPEKVVKLFYRGAKVFDMELDFLTEGPVYCRNRTAKKRRKTEKIPNEPGDYDRILLSLLSSPNITSKEWVIRQYDHEVRGGTVIKPLHGKINSVTHADASVIKPLEHSFKGLALSVSSNPYFSSVNPLNGGKSVIDEVCRNIVSVGARPHSLTDCLNFGNPEKPNVMYDFYETVKGIGEICSYLNLPIPSGNVSFYNETEKGSIPPTPVILGVGIVDDIRKCVTVDLKKEGNPLYLIGETKNEMGGSAYYRLVNGYSNNVPDVDKKKLEKTMSSLLNAMKKGYIAACHDVSDGGLGVCISEMCIGGNIGSILDISRINNLRTDINLFSESNTRWVVEVKKNYEKRFRDEMKNIKISRIGKVGGGNIVIKDRKEIINLPMGRIKKEWGKTLWGIMG